MNFADVFEFTSDLKELRRQYKGLSQVFHPDKGGTAQDFQNLKIAYENAIDAITNKLLWIAKDSVILQIKNKTFRFKWKYMKETDDSYQFDNEKYVVFVSKKGYEDLASSAEQNLSFIRSKNFQDSKVDGLRKTIRLIPDFYSEFTDIEHGIISFTKPGNVFPLSAVLSAYGNSSGSFSIPHATWMTGRLLNFLCFLNAAGVVHGGISLDSMWVDLDSHELYVYGGWQFSRKTGEKFVALPAEGSRLIDDHIASMKLSSELIRILCLRLYHARYNEIVIRKDIPRPVIDFLSVPFSGNPVETYKRWEKIRDSSWERKFTKFDYSSSMIYNSKR